MRPLLQHIQARHLLEIGADRGDHTRLLIRYCDFCNGTLKVIEPAVSDTLKEIVERSTRTMLFADRSCEALPHINSAIDAVIMEGDLNHHTVYDDLCGIEDLCGRCNTAFPVIFVKNISWPYARRDMYYAPEMISPEARHEYAYNGMTPWSSTLQRGMINAPFANAEKEGGERNGVLTAVEDFMKVSAFPLRLFSLPLFYGLGIIHVQDSPVAEFIRHHIQPPPALALFLETTEIARINDILRRLQPPMPLKSSGNLLAGALRRLGRFIIKRIEK